MVKYYKRQQTEEEARVPAIDLPNLGIRRDETILPNRGNGFVLIEDDDKSPSEDENEA